MRAGGDARRRRGRERGVGRAQIARVGVGGDHDRFGAAAGGGGGRLRVVGVGGVASALLARAQAGGVVCVVVEARALRGNEREARLLERLAAAGARVRVANRDGDEKLCVAGARGWVGSANATAALPGTVDWGLRTRDRAVVDGLRAAFAREWNSARPFADTQACWIG